MPAPLPPRFSSTATADAVSATVAVVGELDLDTADTFDGAVTEALTSGLPVVVDFSACTFMDSTGLQRVLRHREAATQAGQGFALVVVPGGPVDRLLELVAPGLFLHAQTADEARSLATAA